MASIGLPESWERVAKSGDEVPLFFYSHLFIARPDLRALFPVSMSAQRDKLVGALGRVVSDIDRFEESRQFLEQLGRDHRRFSVVAEHYGSVGESLFATLEHFLGAEWTPDLATEWRTAYGLVAEVMVQAAERADSEPPWWIADVVDIDHRTLDVAVLQLRPQRRYVYRPGQSIALETSMCPRLWRYFSPANAPREDGTIELHVQVVAGGMVSGALVNSLDVGDTVRLGPPVGDRLTRQEHERRDILMVSGGTGLAPLRAVLEQLDYTWMASGWAPDVHLVQGARTGWDLYEHDRLTRLADRPWFRYTEVVSEDPSFPGPRGLVGAVASSRQFWQGRVAMVCGSPQMVSHAVAELAAAGMPRADIRFEELATIAAAKDPRPVAG